MPSLRTLGDADELENRYIDKYVIYVEGESDQKIWERVVGFDIADRIEFKVPQSAGSGYLLVCARVADERPRNPKIFGLIDGEVSSAFSCVDRLISCSSPLFTLDVPALDGILFLAEHEVENVLLRFSKLSHYIVNDVRMTQPARDLSEVEKALLSLSCRYFVAALFKYASAHLKASGVADRIIDVGRFRQPESMSAVIKEIKQKFYNDENIDPDRIMEEVRSVATLVRKSVFNADIEIQQREILRLSEGKGLFGAVRAKWGISQACEGHLLDEVSKSAYSGEFRDSLLELTAGAAAH